MKKYSIIPLLTEHADEICEDIAKQYENGIATEAMMIMSLVPEGDPVIDKADVLCKKYDVFAEKLAARGINAGILVQSSIGHGYMLSKKAPFQHVVSLLDGNSLFRVCPYDEDFRQHIKKAFSTIARRKPSSIMLDDDFRLFATSHKGCACPLHLKEIGKRIGREITREELLEILNKNTKQSREMMKVYFDTQVDSLIGAAKAMREGIDEVDPSIPGSFCLCGDTAEGAKEIAQMLAGKDNPVIIRIHNGNYTPQGTKKLTLSMHRCASQMSVIGDGVDYFLAETDTCPHNRYSTSAANLHAHFTCSILEGVKGCKHWITKTNTFEPKSGEQYRKKLSKYAGFYEALSEITGSVKWVGCRIPLVGTGFIPTLPVASYKHPSEIYGWGGCVLERLGLPMYFSSKNGGIACFDGRKDEFFSDDEIKKMLASDVFLSVETAKNLTERGFGELLGVKVEEIPADDTRASSEFINDSRISLQKNLHRLTPTSDNTIERSTVYYLPNRSDQDIKFPLFPAVTSYKNELGGNVVVFAGTPQAEFKYTEGFSFLCSSRKEQLISLMKDAGQLPIYYPDDADVYLKAGYMPDGSLFCSFTNLCLDNIDNITLVVDKEVTEIVQLSPDGKWKNVSFTFDGGVLTLDVPAMTLHPVILKIK